MTLMLWGLPQVAKGKSESLRPAGRSSSSLVTNHQAALDGPAVARGGDDIHSTISDPASLPANLPLSFTATFTSYLPIAFKPITLKGLITQTTITLPQPLAAASGNWCT